MVESLFEKVPEARTQDDVCRFFSEQNGTEGLAWVKKVQPALAAAGGGPVTVAENQQGRLGAEHAVVVSVAGRQFATVSVVEADGAFRVVPAGSSLVPRS